MITIDNVCANYGTRQALRGVSTSAQAGEFIALIGPNGSGKSTLIKSIAGLMKVETGQVLLSGQHIQTLPLKARAKKIAYLAQSREAAPSMSVEDVVRLGRAPYRGALGKISQEGETEIAEALLKTQADALKNRRFDGLSGGEQARALLARALAVGAPILLADEPIAALDPYYQVTMMQILKDETKNGTLVIAALHDLALAQKFADRIWVMDKGKLAADEKPGEALTPDILKRVFGIRPPKGGFQAPEITE